MARKKVVFVIVEGPSDETALGVALSQMFDKESVHIHIMHEDITTRTGVTSQNIVDTDAVYIPEGNIVEDKQCEELSYQSDGIHTNDVSKVISRNKQKSENLYRLRGCRNIWDVPYRVYYMACNLDHVLYGKRNSTDEEKEQDAYAFAKTYKNNVAGFLSFMCESSFSVKGDFEIVWAPESKDFF